MDKRIFICKVLDYINSNFSSRLVLEELAKASGYSVPHFSRLFTDYTGTTPIQYVNIVRVQNAARILAESTKSITCIAFDCGFETLEVFERCFKKYFGLSAAKYRAQNCVVDSHFYLSEYIYYESLRYKMMIDGGNSFDWGKTAEFYAKSRNIYPKEFWENLHSLGVGSREQRILDIGTGPGILPNNMIQYGGKYTGIDLSPQMIEHARKENPDIEYLCADAHKLPFENSCFDIITALQCWVYFDKEILMPELHRVLKPNGYLYVMFMTWLPDEDDVIRKSFALVKKYNPSWSGFMKRAETLNLSWAKNSFSLESISKKDYHLPFTRESWRNRMVASRGIGASLSQEQIEMFENDLMNMLNNETTEEFSVLHEAVIIKLKREA